VEPYKDGLLAHLKHRTENYVPLQSSLWVGTHAVDTMVDGKVQNGSTDTKIETGDGLTSEMRDNMWKGYSRTGKTVTTIDYKTWETKRAERAKVASMRYRKWQNAYANDLIKSEITAAASAAIAGSSGHLPAFDNTRYVAGSSLLKTPH